MKKFGFIALAVLVGLVLVGVAFGDKDTSSTTKVVETPAVQDETTTSTTMNDEAVKTVACIKDLDHVTSGLGLIIEGIKVFPYTSATKQHEFVASAKDFLQTSIAIVTRCAYLSPETAASTLHALRELDSSLDELGNAL